MPHVLLPPVAWRTLLGDHVVTRALKAGDLASPDVHLDVANEPVPNKAFKRVVRALEFDVAELALMTFLMARSRGVPLCLFPVVLFSRNPLPYLVCNADRGRLMPRDLMGRRVGVRAYTTTTAVWIRALLADRFDVDSRRVQWVTYEEGHVADVEDPPHVHRDPASANLGAMLLDGTIDAAIVDPVPADPRIEPVVPDAVTAYREWQRATGALTLNHIIVVRDTIANDRHRMTALFELFKQSRERAGAADLSSAPIGLDAMRRSLEVAIAAAASQQLLARPLDVDDLVTDVLASLA